MSYLCWYTKKGTIFHNRPRNQFINIISDFFSQLPFLLFQYRSLFVSLFPSNSEHQLVSAHLKRALQCSPVIALHTLAYSWGKALPWSLVRCICVFYKLRGCLGQSAVCRGSLLLFGCLIILWMLSAEWKGAESPCMLRFEWAKTAKQETALLVHWVHLAATTPQLRDAHSRGLPEQALQAVLWARHSIQHSMCGKECYRGTCRLA